MQKTLRITQEKHEWCFSLNFTHSCLLNAPIDELLPVHPPALLIKPKVFQEVRLNGKTRMITLMISLSVLTISSSQRPSPMQQQL